MAHAPFPPSSADRWLACPGSFGLSLHLPDPPDSGYAAEGTRLHDIVANLLMGKPVGNHAMQADIDFLKPYVEHCRKLQIRAIWHSVEERINHSLLLFGTGDFRCLDNSGVLHIVDLKTGQGVMVEPEENAQLLLYAYMSLVGPELKAAPLVCAVELTIVQPPDTANPVKSWTTTVEHVMDFGRKAEAAITDILAGKSDLVAGEHCRWCKAKPVCPKLRGVLQTLPAGLHVAELAPAQAADVLDRADLVLQFIDAVRAHAHDLASRGITVPGWVLKPKRATRQWVDEDKVLEIARRRKIKIWQDKLMSPAMAEKAHPSLPAELQELIVAVSSGTNLVRGNPVPREALPPDAPKMERLMANFETLKYRK